jgi:N-hydroxyarylamine O-acetyltransferase
MPDELTSIFARSAETRLSDELLSKVITRLGLPTTISIDLAGLKSVYAAWCNAVPFDNVRKMIAIRSGGDAAMPGLDADDFFRNWLANGSGGTCWPSSNALFTLLYTLGFDARRVAGAMFDLPDVNHGTVKVKIDGQDWLVDSGMLTNVPLPLTKDLYINDDPNVGVEIEYVDGTHIVWIEFLPFSEYVPCRLRLDPVNYNYYHERYEHFSRQFSPFNTKLYMRRGGPKGATVIAGGNEFAKTPDGMSVRPFSPEELPVHLRENSGLSDSLVEQWTSAGCLESTYDESASGPKLEVPGKRPSLR